MATHSSILAWRIPWTEEPGGLQSIGSQRVRHSWSDWAHTWHWEHCSMLYGSQDERGVWGRMDTCTCKAESLCYPPESIKTFLISYAAAAAKLLQSCPTLCNPINGSPPGSPIPRILQARILERVAISFSNAWKRKVTVKSLSHVWLLVTPWTAAYRLLCPWESPGKSTGAGCHCLLQFKIKV